MRQGEHERHDVNHTPAFPAMHNRTDPFCGPVFIVGMPRSGTKLVRDLLNQHPLIFTPRNETHFIPALMRWFGMDADLSDDQQLRAVCRAVEKTTFYTNSRSQGLAMDLTTLLERMPSRDWPGFFQAMLAYYGGGDGVPCAIWGDKTPGYLRHMKFLKSIFSLARFIHVIRDPRDTALSEHKVWGKSLLRSADRWAKHVATACEDGALLGTDYLQVYYEHLLAQPETVLRSMCDHLGVEYQTSMMTLERPSENLGDTRGYLTIQPGNIGKYRKELKPRQVKHIERIVGPVASRHGYEMEYAPPPRPIGYTQQKLLRMHDAFTMLRFYMKEHGPIDGVVYFGRQLRHRPWP